MIDGIKRTPAFYGAMARLQREWTNAWVYVNSHSEVKYL